VIFCLVCVLGPIWLIGQFIKSRAANRLSSVDAAVIAQIAQIADRMDRRMEAVERVLDSDTPAWRNSSETGGQYERRVG